ncbi:nuclear transport factor 2 family protein [Spirosoma sordidisoli]|uniref:Nuclear transport factor 2 family protein n=1 Tax=Spirosoma sordidisoli TaxID=2502893 RepID=A0A4Q2UC81_9BACT|nr:nuclear transport factor 2 family protein [Spirosoma sordidisoli]RYC66607.1 nuclear transport factor 2 family protein [Spirosoma sordidisoli]
MATATIEQALLGLVDLVHQGKPMEAFDLYYHPDLEKTDLDGVTVTGLAENYRIGAELLSKITTVRTFAHRGTLVVGDRSFVVWELDFDHADNGRVAVTEVAIQDWQAGRIIRERFIA